MTAVSVSLGKELLEKIDERAGRLGITRSVYLSNLARNDLAQGGNFVIQDKFKKEKENPQNYPAEPSPNYQLNDRHKSPAKRKKP